MKKAAFFDTRPYDREWFSKLDKSFEIKFFEEKLNPENADLAKGFDAAIAFVNDTINRNAIEALAAGGVKVLAMRCAGYNNIDFKAAYDNNLKVLRVPVYSPYAVAEHAMALLLTLNRKIHRAYNRTRDFNFSLNGLTGFDLHGRTMGVIGTGKIGQIFIKICQGFGMRVIAYDPYPIENAGFEYVDLDTLYRESDAVSLHCPLTDSTHHILNADAFSKMRTGVYIINTSRGGLIDSEALLEAIKSRKIAGAGLDVYEEEASFFFEDRSDTIINDDTLARIITLPNVILTSHQAFLTNEALKNIAEVTIANLEDFFAGKPLKNEVCYCCTTDSPTTKCN
ncbi:MAG: 2-hydroxyacid dehydrogenase [Oscillospiraceae bacterium]|nr:2-hydroxyacid dehydrogenase [Oscillospiraceae bacterium]